MKNLIIILFFSFPFAYCLSQTSYKEKYEDLKHAIAECDLSTLDIVTGRKITYEVDSFLVSGYTIKVMGCNSVREFIDSNSQLLTLDLFYHMFLYADELHLRLVANAYLIELFYMQKEEYLKFYPSNDWKKNIHEELPHLWDEKFKEVYERFNKDIDEIRKQ